MNEDLDMLHLGKKTGGHPSLFFISSLTAPKGLIFVIGK